MVLFPARPEDATAVLDGTGAISRIQRAQADQPTLTKRARNLLADRIEFVDRLGGFGVFLAFAVQPPGLGFDQQHAIATGHDQVKFIHYLVATYRDTLRPFVGTGLGTLQ